MLTKIVDKLVFDWFALERGMPLGEALHFFLYDITFITLLLICVTIFMGAINAYFPIEILRKKLESRRLFGLENFLAAMLGAITPFCSCSSIPLFVGFLKGGIPLGVTLSFLITSPLVNEIAVVLLLGLFGFKFAAAYAISGIMLGTILGLIFSRCNLERYLEPWVMDQINADDKSESSRSIKWKLIFQDAFKLVRRLFKYIFIGVFIGSIIHGYVPADFIETHLGRDNLFAVPCATAMGVPMYTNATGIIPIIQGLVSKGIPIGTALAFMMAVVGLSLPEAILLKQVMKLKMIIIFFVAVGISIMLLGYLFNALNF